MNIRVESAGQCRKNVFVEVPADLVKNEFGEVVQAYSQYAKIPGFRPGRAPRDLVRKRFAKEIAQEVKERLVPRAYQEAVKQQNIQTVAVLDVKEDPIEEGQPFSFTVVVDVTPEFPLPDYRGLKIEGKKIEISEEDVDSTIKRLQDQGGRYDDVSGRPVQTGDLVQVDYEGTIDGQPVETVAPKAAGLGKAKDFWLIADKEDEFLPGFAEALIGANVGDTRTAEVTFPETFVEKAVAGKKASYTAVVKGLRERKPAELNEEFLKSLAVESVDVLRTRVREDLQKMREDMERRRRQGDVVKKLLEAATFEVPESVLASETRNEVYDLVQQNQYRGVSQDDIEGRKEELFETATRNATDRVKLRYILRGIAREEKVEITPEEITARIAGLAQQYRTTIEKVRADLQKNNAMGRIEDEVRLTKTLALILDKADVQLAGS